MPTLTGMHTNRSTGFHEYPHASRRGRWECDLPSPPPTSRKGPLRPSLYPTYVHTTQASGIRTLAAQPPSLFTDRKGTAPPDSEPLWFVTVALEWWRIMALFDYKGGGTHRPLLTARPNLYRPPSPLPVKKS